MRPYSTGRAPGWEGEKPAVLEVATPLWLAGLPVPPLAWWALRRRRESAAVALLHPLAGLIRELQGGDRRPIWPLLWMAGCALIVIALARPQWVDPGAADLAPGHDVVFAVDVSGSMRALDYLADGAAISRLDMVRRSLGEFLGEARALRAGLVVFADDALTLLPLTTDLAVAAAMTREIDNSLAGERTAIGDAIALATRRLESSPGSSRFIVLLTDGTHTAGAVQPEAAVALARARGVRVYTVGFGGDAPVRFPLGTGDSVAATLPPDTGLLARLATAGDGEFHRVREASDMRRVLDAIHAAERSLVPVPVDRRDWYWLPALAGLLLLIAAEYRRQREVSPA